GGGGVDEGLADEVGNLRDGGEDRDVADQQIEERVLLLLDHLPFRLWRQQDGLHPIDELQQVICPHVVLQAAPRCASLCGSCLARDLHRRCMGDCVTTWACDDRRPCVCLAAVSELRLGPPKGTRLLP